MLISDKINFSIVRLKEGHFILERVLIHQEDVNNENVSTPNN